MRQRFDVMENLEKRYLDEMDSVAIEKLMWPRFSKPRLFLIEQREVLDASNQNFKKLLAICMFQK